MLGCGKGGQRIAKGQELSWGFGPGMYVSWQVSRGMGGGTELKTESKSNRFQDVGEGCKLIHLIHTGDGDGKNGILIMLNGVSW